MRGGFSGRESHFGNWGFRDTNSGRCSGGKGANRRGTGEQGEGRESTWWDGRGAGLHHGNHQGLWRRGRSRNQVYRDVGSGTQRAASVAVGAVRMGVGDLHGAGDDHQKNADQREENAPRTSGTGALVVKPHTTPLYRRVWDACTRGPDADRLFASFDAWSDQTNVVYLSLVAHVDHFGDLAKVEGRIALDEHHLLLAGSVNFG